MEKLVTSSSAGIPVIKASSPADEASRLKALRQYQILDTGPEERFDEITRLAAEICSTPIAILALVEADRIFYKSKIGLTELDTDRNGSFCSWAILGPDIFVVPNALKDDRFSQSASVKGRPRIRFFAGAPLITPEGHAIGAMAVLDLEHRELTPSQTRSLRTLAGTVMAQLDLRRKNLELEQINTERVHMEEMVRLSDELLNEVEKRNAELANINATLKRQTDERQQAFETLAASEERYALVARSQSDGLWDWDLKTNEIHFCSRWKAMLGYAEDEIGTRPDEWFNRIHPEDLETVHSELLDHLLGSTTHFHNEHRLHHKNGKYHWMLSRGVAVWDANKEVYRMAGSLTNITSQKEAERQLRHNAFHDPLTALPNRALFMDRLKRSLDRATHGEDYLFAVLFLDMDRFKVVNDSLGHDIGDQLLVAIARRLEASLRPGDMVARLGGDEFAIILDHLKHINDATHAAERIQKELATPFNLSGHEMFASASIGISVSLTPYDLPEDILRNADTAMYRAKENGRGGFELFDEDMHARAVALMQLETDLRKAVSRKEFRVYYQPIISLAAWQITGFEALLRWEHPQQGFISPLEFIAVAEETGLIIPIGQWVLKEACQQLRSWNETFSLDPPLTMSVNLSGKQFLQPDLIETVGKILTETGIDARNLKIEITESAIIENIESATEILKQLKELGVRVSLDDFGTGYSSLSYLHRFPIDTLKIDRSFVTRMNLPKNSEIVRTIVTLAANLGMDVIAEGVETGEQIIQLTGMNCEYGQGYLFSKPMDGEAIKRLIEETYQKGLGQHAKEV
ncbi:MAG: EAL domain-containing protein [Blastocatellia bacterium]|nr:EAL domain-containing protein [Blastocatellia bacterium]